MDGLDGGEGGVGVLVKVEVAVVVLTAVMEVNG